MQSFEKMNTTVADVVVQSLIFSRVDTVYGVVSIHNMPIYDAIARDGRIRIVPARSEGAAVNMADAHARVTGQLGVALTSTGTGAGNAVGALIEAWSAGSPVLHITGEVATPFLGTGRGYIHECKNQLGIMENSVKSAYRMRRSEEASGMLLKAIQGALGAPRGPVSLEIPIDIQSASAGVTEIILPELCMAPIPRQIETVVENLIRAKRPVMWVGGGAVSADAAKEVLELASTLQIPVITTQSGRGLIPEDHPLCLGNFANFAQVGELLESADLLLSVGVRFRSNETAAWKYSAPKNHIGIDVDLSSANRNYPNSLTLVGDAKVILRHLLTKLNLNDGDVARDSEYLAAVNQVRTQVRQGLRDTLGPYEQLMDSMRQTLPRDTIIVRDVTVPSSSWGSRLLEIYSPRTSVHAAGGGIGQGLPMAIGAQIGQPKKPVCLMVGDGGLLVNIGELATMRQENLPIIIILFDDSGYGVLRNIQDRQYQRRVGVDLVSPEFVNVAQAFGLASKCVSSVEEFANAIESAVAKAEPCMLVVDMDAVGPMHKPFGGPPGV